ncbi:hypothetical protein [Celeribacter marinus]|uniref:Uncharacterized protein n=1 Tax=Celeribacter marinus TaxID=1397108 RepID=A0A0N9ZRD4_9RHOB|nr:hypothetical protein [Celeribacter marinus]ALI56319.1 hypothetical protein IMCC12053_2372 [Celeribacter marinus]SFK46259.1 hypothetical protein SAMN05444421_104233 [Celeribacter marinus]
MTGETAYTPLVLADLDDISALPRNAWCAALDDTAEELGYFEELGPDHACAFIEGNGTLLVSFDTFAHATQTSPNGYPVGFNIALANGWSHLSLIAHSNAATAPWFRAQPIYDAFDRYVESGFFDDYDRVVFYGAGPCGYAACAFSVAAPGAHVIALAPQATLDSRLACWDDRYPSTKRADFTARYGFAPHMIEGAQAAWILYDPHETVDAMHASLFNAAHVVRRPVPYFGANLEARLIEMGGLEPLLAHAASGTLTPATLSHLLRARQTNKHYLHNLLTALEAHDNPARIFALCQHVCAIFPKARRFRQARKRARLMLADPQSAPSHPGTA